MIACALVAIAMTAAAGSPQAPTDRQLYDEVVRADRVMFDAFNSRNLDGLMASFSEDLEFYHDKDGRQSFADVRGGFDRMFKSPEAPRRELVAGSLRVYPIPKFGAMQMGRTGSATWKTARTTAGCSTSRWAGSSRALAGA